MENTIDDQPPDDRGSAGTPLLGGTRLFQIYESDLAELEQSLPELSWAVGLQNDRRLKTHLRRLKRIVSDVRWNYGPHDNVQIVEPE